MSDAEDDFLSITLVNLAKNQCAVQIQFFVFDRVYVMYMDAYGFVLDHRF